MIVVNTWSEDGMAVLEVMGHATNTQPACFVCKTIDPEAMRVCAAVSVAAVMLLFRMGMPNVVSDGASGFKTKHGEWHGDESGYVKVLVPESHKADLAFVLFSILTLQENYEEHIEIIRGEEPSWMPWPSQSKT